MQSKVMRTFPNVSDRGKIVVFSPSGPFVFSMRHTCRNTHTRSAPYGWFVGWLVGLVGWLMFDGRRMREMDVMGTWKLTIHKIVLSYNIQWKLVTSLCLHSHIASHTMDDERRAPHRSSYTLHTTHSMRSYFRKWFCQQQNLNLAQNNIMIFYHLNRRKKHWGRNAKSMTKWCRKGFC